MLDVLVLLTLQAAPTMADYPLRALREGREGVTEFRVRTDVQGRVAECRIVRSSGSPDLDAATCNLATRRMKVTPPLDDRGQPMPAQWASKMEWRIASYAPASADRPTPDKSPR